MAAAQVPAGEAPTRAGDLAAERNAKAQRLSPPQRSLLERALYWYDNHDAKLGWRGIHFGTGNFPGGAGLAFGVGFTRHAIGSPFVDPQQANRFDVDLVAARSILGYQRLAARTDVLNIGGAPIDLELRWRDDQLPQEDFFGFGPDSQESHRVNYRLDGAEAGAGLRWRPLRKIAVGAGVAYLSPTLGPGTDRRFPSAETAFAPSSLPGFENLPDFLQSNVSLGFDWRDNATHPRRGGHYEATTSRFDDRGTEGFEFSRIDVNFQQIVPLGNRYRRIELRATAAMTDPNGDGDVPMIYQPALGGLETMRGFRQSRFRDRNAVAMSAEYQWEAWWALDAAVFVDAGQVMRRLRDFDVNALEMSYGIGFRLHSNSAFVARLDLAYSREGFVPLLGFKYGF